MARGVRSNPVLLPTFSPNLQPQSLASYDPKTRRNTILIAEIVPTLDLSEDNDAAAVFVPSDRYYVNCGAWDSAARVPPWLQNISGITFEQWDSTLKRFYMTHAAGAELRSAIAKFIHPAGHMGGASSYAPKNARASGVWMRFTAAFTTNGDYGVDGIGATNASAFNTATDHFIQATRNGSSWELGTCDGSTISQQAGGAADGNPHEFGIKWTSSDVTLHVDGEAVITKTTNLPDRPLRPVPLQVSGGTNVVRLYDYLVEWEAS